MEGDFEGKESADDYKTLLDELRAILQESEVKLEMKNFKPPSIFVWR